MKSNEEKVKEFFNDKSKIKGLANDEKFISKVSGGTATAQTYVDEFKKFDINLTKKEAEEISKTTDKILSVPVEKLDDESVADVVGGGDKAKTVGQYLGITAVATVGFGVASLACAYKSVVEEEKGNDKKAHKYEKAAQHLWTAAGTALVTTPMVIASTDFLIDSYRFYRKAKYGI